MSSCRGWKFVPLMLCSAGACSSAFEPRENVTLFVTNGTCASGTCSPLRILGFPNDQPHTPGGFWSIELGILTGPSACLFFPASREFHVTEMPLGTQTTYRWNSSVGLALGAQLTTESQLMASPSTSEFVPASVEAWAVTLPGAGQPSPTSACSQ